MKKNYNMYGASEHKEANSRTLPDRYYGYVFIEHESLGEFYVSVGCFKKDVRTDGNPWNFLRSKKYELTDEQVEFVNSHKEEIFASRA